MRDPSTDPHIESTLAGTAEGELSRLLRGEIAAAETYHQALEKVTEEQVAQVLREIQQDHGEVIAFFTEELAKLDVPPPTASGPWGAFAKAVEGAAKLFGNKSALIALCEGERHGLRTYTDALQSGLLPDASAEFVSKRAVPMQEKHLDALGRLIEAM